ncbi:MAG: glycosyl transferase, partial [Gemmobacter sp.]
RQHARNGLGQGEGFRAGLAVKHGVLRGSYATRIGSNLQALGQIAGRLTPENRQRLEIFGRARAAGPLGRLAGMRQAGVYRQGLLARCAFWGAVCFGRI